ncbi:MAG: HD family phosphohydrolase [Candidatus Komeilibacteria bacterium CG_4_10_14_0_2_um_filter_37_10]|uniref:HD family phosphohydrolase n=1 Tax=Candidatus Komeilibacteria bacterium CG_4_10_14_0_2_um_filter_37_10 TaxID=1974470 RepID=A0A2M7VEG3_9BACT|nr:MAG: HD family phosphohydrolase [Candidatus Komeilibacteria bacterium CG_4_10_14_0_2_um_filter_37_10]
MLITIVPARELIKKYLLDHNNQIHSRESEVVLRTLAQEFGENEEEWGLAGLLHDLDWELTQQDHSQHGLKTSELLKQEGYELAPASMHAISAHNQEGTDVLRSSQLDYALAAGETITGLIYATALLRPEKLTGMTASSLNKKFKDRSFAAKVSRETIMEIEKIGLEKNKFFELAIVAMQEIAVEIGL